MEIRKSCGVYKAFMKTTGVEFQNGDGDYFHSMPAKIFVRKTADDEYVDFCQFEGDYFPDGCEVSVDSVSSFLLYITSPSVHLEKLPVWVRKENTGTRIYPTTGTFHAVDHCTNIFFVDDEGNCFDSFAYVVKVRGRDGKELLYNPEVNKFESGTLVEILSVREKELIISIPKQEKEVLTEIEVAQCLQYMLFGGLNSESALGAAKVVADIITPWKYDGEVSFSVVRDWVINTTNEYLEAYTGSEMGAIPRDHNKYVFNCMVYGPSVADYFKAYDSGDYNGIKISQIKYNDACRKFEIYTEDGITLDQYLMSNSEPKGLQQANAF